MPLTHLRTIPMLRSFDEAKAREFYVDFLGFKVDWEHRFEPGMPLYMQVSRDGIVFHITEHHGDGSPGAHVRVAVSASERLRPDGRTAAQQVHDIMMALIADGRVRLGPPREHEVDEQAAIVYEAVSRPP